MFYRPQLRKTAIYVNASPQRAQAFSDMQTEHPALSLEGLPQAGKLRLLQDVKTRWNSTYLMAVRCVRLRRAVDAFLGAMGGGSVVDGLKLGDDEWKMVEYLVELMKPYAMHGAALGAVVRPTIDMVWEKYNSLFDHIEKERESLRRKRQAWKHQLLPALDAAEEKLREYYGRTKGDLGSLYNIGNMLNPSQKNTTYRRREWESQYFDQFTNEFVSLFRRHYGGQQMQAGLARQGRGESARSLWSLARAPAGSRQRGAPEVSEAVEYLREGE